jgi:hypothetical protein
MGYCYADCSETKCRKNFGYQYSQKMAAVNSTILECHQSVLVLIVTLKKGAQLDYYYYYYYYSWSTKKSSIHSIHIQNSRNVNASLLCNNGWKYIKNLRFAIEIIHIDEEMSVFPTEFSINILVTLRYAWIILHQLNYNNGILQSTINLL